MKKSLGGTEWDRVLKTIALEKRIGNWELLQHGVQHGIAEGPKASTILIYDFALRVLSIEEYGQGLE